MDKCGKEGVGMKLFDRLENVNIVLKSGADEAIQLAAADLQSNLRDLSGIEDGFSTVNDCADVAGIYIHTQPSDEAESYAVCVDDEKVLITGSDTLGTVYGIYAFATNCLNITPTYRLTDVFPKQMESLELEPQTFKSNERQVRFRGWFINDEDLLSEYKTGGGKRHMDYAYYQNVMATDVLDMVLETALRLENNLIIPASFLDIDNPDEEELVKAAYRRGLYISQHHIEPMGVSYFTAENYMKKYGNEGEEISFFSNRTRMEEMWKYYAKKWAVYGKQVVWQFGLRGKADVAIWETDSSVPMSMEARGQIISDAIQTQYNIVNEVLGTDEFYSTTTLWNEGSGLYEEGYLSFPKDTILVFADFGTDQMFGEDLYITKREADRKCGVYYHVAYWTLGPHFTEGCNPKKMAFNYQNAAMQDKLYYSILNVSNVRPFHLSVTMNARIMENPLGIDICEETLIFDRAIFGDVAEEVNALRHEYYECFADFTEYAIQRKAAGLHFSYRPYENLPFLRNPATDGQMAWYARKTLSAKVHTDRPDAKADIPSMKESVKKFTALYEKMVAIEEKLPTETVPYFRQFLKYQTRHMQLLTEFAIGCQALVDETLSWEERKAQGEYGYSRLALLLDERKVLEEGKWENWHRGDRKLELPMYLDRMRNYILARE